MKTRKPQLLFFCLIFCLQVTISYSQPPPPPGRPPSPEERIKHVSEKLQKDLTLTSAQTEKVKMAYKDFFTGIDKLRKNGKQEDLMPPSPPPPPPGRKEEMDKLAKTRDEKIKGVLSAAQYKKYQEVEKEMRPGPRN